MKALRIAETAIEPHIEISNLDWPGNADWKSVYNRVDDSNRETLLKMGEENRRRRGENKARGLTR